MSSDGLAEVGPWAREKLDTLGRYLDFYGTVLSKQSWCKTIYLDAYAGGGRAVVRALETEPRGPDLFGTPVDPAERELINGSPRVALDIRHPFARYVFAEPSAARFIELEALKAEKADRYIKLIKGTARDGIEWVTSQAISEKTHRGVAFLDPFGANLAWADIVKLADTDIFEIFVNLSLNMSIVRMLPNSGVIQESWANRLDALFGDRSWHAEAYEPAPRLFGADRPVKRPDYERRLLNLYLRKLKGVFKHVSTPRLVRNTRACPLYYLIWAGNHPKGRQGAEHILTMGERVGKA